MTFNFNIKDYRIRIYANQSIFRRTKRHVRKSKGFHVDVLPRLTIKYEHNTMIDSKQWIWTSTIIRISFLIFQLHIYINSPDKEGK